MGERLWRNRLHVPFDLGTVLGREKDGFNPPGGFFDAMGQNPVLAHGKLIRAPRDIGPGAYQPGRFPRVGGVDRSTNPTRRATGHGRSLAHPRG